MTNTSVNPARSIGPALFVGGWALSQLWLFVIAPLLGAVLAVGVYLAMRQPEVLITARQAEQALASQQAERDSSRAVTRSDHEEDAGRGVIMSTTAEFQLLPLAKLHEAKLNPKLNPRRHFDAAALKS